MQSVRIHRDKHMSCSFISGPDLFFFRPDLLGVKHKGDKLWKIDDTSSSISFVFVLFGHCLGFHPPLRQVSSLLFLDRFGGQ